MGRLKRNIRMKLLFGLFVIAIARVQRRSINLFAGPKEWNFPKKDFPEMYESKKQKRIQTVDEMLRQRKKISTKVNTNPKILAGTEEAINKFVADRRAWQLKQIANKRSYHKNSNPNDAAVGEIDLSAVFYPREDAVVIRPHNVINSGLIAFGNSETEKSYAENLERLETSNGSRNSTGDLIKDALSAVDIYIKVGIQILLGIDNGA